MSIERGGPSPEEIGIKEPNPYEGLDNLSPDELSDKVDNLNLDQLTWLNSKIDLELKKVEADMQNSELGNYDMKGSAEPVKGELGLTLDELTQKKATLEKNLETVKAAIGKKDENLEMTG